MRDTEKMLKTLDRLSKLHPELADELAPVKAAVFMPLDFFCEKEAEYRLDEAGITCPEETQEQFAEMLKTAEIIDAEKVQNLLEEFRKEHFHRYFCSAHPPVPGSIPCPEKTVRVEDFDEKEFCPEIGGEAWGCADYTEPLDEEQCMNYGLIPEGMKPYWCVTTTYRDSGSVSAAITIMIRAMEKPENQFLSLRDRDIYNDWFDSLKEAEMFVEISRKNNKERMK